MGFLRKQSCDWSICSWWRRGKEGREEGRGSCTSSRRSSRGRRRRRQEEKEEEEGCQVNGINLIDFFLYFQTPIQIQMQTRFITMSVKAVRLKSQMETATIHHN